MTELKPCPFCGSSDFRIEAGGQIWRGVEGYSAPQYYHLRHHCQRTEDNPFSTGLIELRDYSGMGLIERWNND